jgi:hypothetical protein
VICTGRVSVFLCSSRGRGCQSSIIAFKVVRWGQSIGHSGHFGWRRWASGLQVPHFTRLFRGSVQTWASWDRWLKLEPFRDHDREVGFEAHFALNPGGSWVSAISGLDRWGSRSGTFGLLRGGDLEYRPCWRPSTDGISCGVSRRSIGHLVDS